MKDIVKKNKEWWKRKEVMIAALALAVLLIAAAITLAIVLKEEPIERANRILTAEGFTVEYRETELHTDLTARLKATRSGEWLDIYVYKDLETAEAIYYAMLESYEHLPNMIAVIDGTTVIHGHRTAYLLIEK